MNIDLSWSLFLKPLCQPYLAVSDVEKWDHVTAKSASPTLLLRRSISAQSPLVLIKRRWMLSYRMEWALIQSSIHLLLPNVCIFLKKLHFTFLCGVLYIYYYNLLNCWNEKQFVPKVHSDIRDSSISPISSGACGLQWQVTKLWPSTATLRQKKKQLGIWR